MGLLMKTLPDAGVQKYFNYKTMSRVFFISTHLYNVGTYTESVSWHFCFVVYKHVYHHLTACKCPAQNTCAELRSNSANFSLSAELSCIELCWLVRLHNTWPRSVMGPPCRCVYGMTHDQLEECLCITGQDRGFDRIDPMLNLGLKPE